TTVVNIINFNEISAPYPFGTSAVRLSLPHPESIKAREPKIVRALIFPIHPFMYVYLSFIIFNCFWLCHAYYYYKPGLLVLQKFNRSSLHLEVSLHLNIAMQIIVLNFSKVIPKLSCKTDVFRTSTQLFLFNNFISMFDVV